MRRINFCELGHLCMHALFKLSSKVYVWDEILLKVWPFKQKLLRSKFSKENLEFVPSQSSLD